ncbi:MAG: protein kinase [Candidatus Latescibacterota bacterium]|nr:MAG: protein kinase [Candidatus Latescibacterota bacterium]
MPAISARNRRGKRSLRRGDMLHKYRIEKLLGGGGFADVYQAYDTVEGVRVALKVFTQRIVETNPSAFRNEVRIISRLDHKNIVRLKTAEIVRDRFIMVTELGERTLFDAYERARPVKYSLHVLDQILEALAYAHDNGVIHRDVKPENILVWRDGRVKITDFGVSRLMDTPVTHTTVTGTPSYRAPEQAYGRPTYASDVFAMALVFYEMVTRVLPRWPLRWPFERHEVFESRVPAALVRVIRRAASFDLEKRYRNAGAMLRAVRVAVPELANGSSPGLVRPEKRLTWREYRARDFEKRYERHLQLDYRCHKCCNSISEFMLFCPWCGYGNNSFATITRFPSVCVRCEHGVYDDWRYCPWCYGAGFDNVSNVPSRDPRYAGRCSRCGDWRLLPHMNYCPWCNSRLRPWRSRQLRERCPGCRNSVANDYWDFCAWCGKDLLRQRARNGRRRTS